MQFKRLRFKPLFFILYFLANSCSRQGENCIYLIPKDYEGNLIIIFDQTEGENAVYDNQIRLYNFDKSGVLKTKFTPNYGTQQNQYYYVDSLGTKTKLKNRVLPQGTNNKDYVILNSEIGTDFDKIKQMKRHFELLTVGQQYHIDSIAESRSKFMWSALR